MEEITMQKSRASGGVIWSRVGSFPGRVLLGKAFVTGLKNFMWCTELLNKMPVLYSSV